MSDSSKHGERDDARSGTVSFTHEWRNPNSWAEVILMRAAGMAVMWIASGVLSIAASTVHDGLVVKRARRLGKGGGAAKKP